MDTQVMWRIGKDCIEYGLSNTEEVKEKVES